jgi:hypothetical protein
MITKTGLAVRAYLRWFDEFVLTEDFTSTEQCVDKIDELAELYNVSSQSVDDMLDIRTNRLWDKTQKIMFPDGNPELEAWLKSKKNK